MSFPLFADTQPKAGEAGEGDTKPLLPHRAAPCVNAEASISVRVQKSLPSTSASLYQRKLVFGPVHKISSAGLYQVTSPLRPLAAPLRRTKTDGTVHQLHRSKTAPARSDAASTAPSPPVSPGALSTHSAGDAAGGPASPPVPDSPPSGPDTPGAAGGEYGTLVKHLVDAAPHSDRKRFRRSSGKLDFLQLAWSRSKAPRWSSTPSFSHSGSSGSNSQTSADLSADANGLGAVAGASGASPSSQGSCSSGASITVQEMLRKMPAQSSSGAPTGPAWVKSSQAQSLLDDDYFLALPSAAIGAPTGTAPTSGGAASPDAQQDYSQHEAQEEYLDEGADEGGSHQHVPPGRLEGAAGDEAEEGLSPSASADVPVSDDAQVFDQSTLLGGQPAQFNYTSESPSPQKRLDESITPSLSSVDQTQGSAAAPPRVALRGPLGALQLEVAPPQPSRTAVVTDSAHAHEVRRVSFGSSSSAARAAFVRNLSSAGLSAGSRAVILQQQTASAQSSSAAQQGSAAPARPSMPPAAHLRAPDAHAAAADSASAAPEASEGVPKWNELAARASSGASKAGSRYAYKPLDSLPVHQRVNLYGVVFDCSLPTATKGSDLKSKLVLMDESRCNMSQAAVVHSFLKQDKHLIAHEAGDVLRLHRVKIVDFQGQEQIQLNNPERVAGGRPSGMIFRKDGSFSATSGNFTLTAEDRQRIGDMMQWAEAHLRENLLYSSAYAIDMQHLVTTHGRGGSAQLEGYKDCLVCIAAVFVNGSKLDGPLTSDTCAPDASVQLLVWDGTGPGGACVTNLPEGESLQALYPPDAGGRQLGALVFVDVTPQAPAVSQLGLKGGDWVRMRNLSPFLLKQGCFPGGVLIPEPDAANQAVLFGLRLHQGGVVKIPTFCRDVQEKLKFVCI